MAAHSKLWYPERFRLLEVLTDAQKQQVAAVTRMLEIKGGQRIYLAGDPSDQIFLLKAGVVRISSPDGDQDGLVDAARRDIRITDPSCLRMVS